MESSMTVPYPHSHSECGDQQRTKAEGGWN